jgi:hypothetical protein
MPAPADFVHLQGDGVHVNALSNALDHRPL